MAKSITDIDTFIKKVDASPSQAYIDLTKCSLKGKSTYMMTAVHQKHPLISTLIRKHHQEKNATHKHFIEQILALLLDTLRSGLSLDHEFTNDHDELFALLFETNLQEIITCILTKLSPELVEKMMVRESTLRKNVIANLPKQHAVAQMDIILESLTYLSGFDYLLSDLFKKLKSVPSYYSRAFLILTKSVNYHNTLGEFLFECRDSDSFLVLTKPNDIAFYKNTCLPLHSSDIFIFAKIAKSKTSNWVSNLGIDYLKNAMHKAYAQNQCPLFEFISTFYQNRPLPYDPTKPDAFIVFLLDNYQFYKEFKTTENYDRLWISMRILIKANAYPILIRLFQDMPFLLKGKFICSLEKSEWEIITYDERNPLLKSIVTFIMMLPNDREHKPAFSFDPLTFSYAYNYSSDTSMLMEMMDGMKCSLFDVLQGIPEYALSLEKIYAREPGHYIHSRKHSIALARFPMLLEADLRQSFESRTPLKTATQYARRIFGFSRHPSVFIELVAQDVVLATQYFSFFTEKIISNMVNNDPNIGNTLFEYYKRIGFYWLNVPHDIMPKNKSLREDVIHAVFCKSGEVTWSLKTGKAFNAREESAMLELLPSTHSELPGKYKSSRSSLTSNRSFTWTTSTENKNALYQYAAIHAVVMPRFVKMCETFITESKNNVLSISPLEVQSVLLTLFWHGHINLLAAVCKHLPADAVMALFSDAQLDKKNQSQVVPSSFIDTVHAFANKDDTQIIFNALLSRLLVVSPDNAQQLIPPSLATFHPDYCKPLPPPAYARTIIASAPPIEETEGNLQMTIASLKAQVASQQETIAQLSHLVKRLQPSASSSSTIGKPSNF